MAVEESVDFILRFSFSRFAVCSLIDKGFTTNFLIGRYLPSRGLAPFVV